MSELLLSNPTTAPGYQPMPVVPPSRKLRWFSRLAAVIWWLCVVAAILFALAWGALHGLIVPRIGDLRPTLENRLTSMLGVPVRIGTITAQSNALAPSFELTDVRLKDALGRDALVLQKVIATVSPRSMLQLGFEQLVIEQPLLDVRRSPQGTITVAGFALPSQQADTAGSSPATDWFFSQREFAIRSGTVNWTDELRGLPPVQLTQVDLVVRNPRRTHQIRLDATPAPEWGDRFTLVGDLRSPLLRAGAGQWRDWEGDLHANFARIDVSQLKRYVDLNFDVARGYGAVRAWASLGQGKITQATVDVALANVQVTLGPKLQPLVMPILSGRLAGQAVSGGVRVATEDLAFRTQEGVQWPGGDVSFLQTGQEGATKSAGELSADKLDLAALSQIADRLPMGATTHALLRSLAPQGLVEVVRASWQGHYSAPTTYEAQGRVKNLNVAADFNPSQARPTDDANPPAVKRPGIRGATIDFKLNQQGGQAAVAIDQGALVLPGIFEDPTVPLDALRTNVKWTRQGEQIDVQSDALTFTTPDGKAEAKFKWRTADPAKSSAKSRFPGVLDLQGNLQRVNGTRVHRYLPVALPQSTRDYVRDAVVQGNVKEAKFTVKGDLFDVPFKDPKLGEFRIAAQLTDVHFAYVPPAIQPADSLPWPPLTQVNAELVFDRASLAVNNAIGRLGSGTGTVQITKADALIADLKAGVATVQVNADTRGALGDMVAIVNTSPLLGITSQALAKAKGSGNADLKLRLNLPLSDLSSSKVVGSVTLTGNDVQMTPDTPLLANAKGLISFNEVGFSLKDIQASMLGGDVRLDGGTRANAGPADASLAFRAQGTMTAQALAQAKELGFASRLGAYASGGTAYTATLAFRKGVAEIAINSDLQGMGLNLPAPLNKAPEAPLPLRYSSALVPASLAADQKLQDQINVDLGSIANIVFVRDISGKEPRVLRGGIGVGLSQGETTPFIQDGVVANINFAQVNLDAWQKLLTGTSSSVGNSVTAVVGDPVSAADSATTSALSSYLPSVMAVRAQELTVQGRTLNNVVVGGSRQGLDWRANLDARELNGYVEYSQPSGLNAGRVYARLARLNLAQAAATEIEAVLDNQPTAIPALDIVVEDFELRGKKLGRIEVEATNLGSAIASAATTERNTIVREWRLNKLNVTVPEAQFTATGNWTTVGSTGLGSRTAVIGSERRRTAMNFKLDIANSGELLKRLGMDQVIAKGRGKMEGQVAWIGSPLALDYPSMSGNFNVNIESGQFLKADPGLGKLLGVLSLQSLPRRLTLDFRDVFTEGFSFDFVRGDVKIEQGVASTNNLQMKGVNAAVLMEGSANIAKETQDLKVVVVPEINAGTASLVAAVINPVIGLTTFLAQLALRGPIIEAATQEFQITGSWVDPKITKVARKFTPASSDNPSSNVTP
jgi:uncharacterized protein (TIGR02099 family)